MRLPPWMVLIASVAALTALPTAIAAQPRLIEYNSERFILVTGGGSVAAAPDFARVTLGVTTTGKDAREAMAANAKSLSAVLAAIKAEGVSAADIQTSGLSISPMFSNQRSNQQESQTITGYTVGDTVTVVMRDIPRLGGLLDRAVAAGANTMYGIAYGQNDPSGLLDKARPLAVADARRKAEIYANAGGAKIGRLMELSEEAIAQPSPFPARAYAQMAGPAPPTPIEAGQDRLTVTVTAKFELTQ
jgi:uncharacterized protein YggE